MTEARENLRGIYRFTSIARPVDPAYLTNRALLIVLPVVGLFGAGLAFLQDTGGNLLSAALSAVLVVFAAWALTRELAPDYSGAAFVALAFAWVANIAFGTRLVLLPFAALVLVRVVNRSTGLPLRPLDTLGVLGFCTWAAIDLEQPLILMIASLAFLLDATLEKPLRRHFLAAAACLLIFFWMLPGNKGLIDSDLTRESDGVLPDPPRHPVRRRDGEASVRGRVRGRPAAAPPSARPGRLPAVDPRPRDASSLTSGHATRPSGGSRPYAAPLSSTGYPPGVLA